MPELQQVLYTIGTNVYQQSADGAAPGGAPGADASSAPSDDGDDVIDAEFSEEDK